jgi:membrane protease YdiL (CAAX protease family)
MPEFPGTDLNLLYGSIAIAVTTFVFLIYYSITSSNHLIHWLEEKFGQEDGSIRKILLHRLTGAILYGMIPVLVILFVFRLPLNHFGTNVDQMAKSIIWWIPAAILAVVINYYAARNKNHLAQYPQMRARQWNTGLITLSALSWTTYLAGYEFMFRGFLLFSCLESFGYWPAIIINISLYSLAHLPKGPTETIASVFFGFILCYISIELGSFWFALFLHISLALSNEWFSIAFHPEMIRVKKNGSG